MVENVPATESRLDSTSTIFDSASVTVKSNANVSVAPQLLDGEKNEHAVTDWLAEELLERVFR